MKSPNKIQLIHPAPVEETPAPDYRLTVNGQPVFTYPARVSAHPLNQVWPGYQRPLEQTEIASFATWDMVAPCKVSIVSVRPVKEVRIRPKSYGIQPKVEGNTIAFTLNKPGQFTVEVNGTHHALHLFVNPMEADTPDPRDPNVRYFGPGVHCPGVIKMTSNQTIYLAGGAVVYGAVIAEKADHLTIRGRGILDGSKFNRFDVNGLITLIGCTNVMIEGLILRDPNNWTLVPALCEQVHIRNVKLIGLWRYNTDGIDFFNSQHCSVEDCFIRSFDDSICFKGGLFYDFNMSSIIYEVACDGRPDFRHRGKYECNLAPVQDIQVHRCVIWNDWGRALEIGAETMAAEISDLLFEDCDIIHAVHVALDVQHIGCAACKRIRFHDIRVELDDDFTRPVYQEKKDQVYAAKPGDRYIPPAIVLEIKTIQNLWFGDGARGRIEDIYFKDIAVTAWGMPPSYLHGYDSEHLVKGVTIENLRINGKAIANLEGNFACNDFVRNVVVK